MFKFIKTFFQEFFYFFTDRQSVKRNVDYSLKKYRNTYDLLEKYDQEATRDPKELADSERLRPFIRELQKKGKKKRRSYTTN